MTKLYTWLNACAVSVIFLTGIETNSFAQKNSPVSTIAADGWANNSVNTVIFRKNSLVTYKEWQYAAYYDKNQYVVLAKRKVGTQQWQVAKTSFTGDAGDAHKSISIIVDGAGYLHVAWGQHNNPLNYAVSLTPGSLQLGPKASMTGQKEGKISYPEFYKLANGNLLFLYRDGGSGNGNLLLNSYDTGTQKWMRLQDNLIDGEGKRNAYWQMAVDQAGTIHLSWVWRETPDVSSNHDMAYACSKDGGVTWQKSSGEKYVLPITAGTAEYACHIPQKSELINQTSMVADAAGHPYIATYWRDSAQTVPQYHLVYHDGKKWNIKILGFRKAAFSLSGGGTKRIPISRPQIIAWKNGRQTAAAIIFRDEELANLICIAVNRDLSKDNWKVESLHNRQVGSWEPTYDTELWKNSGVLNLFIQNTTQVDGEGNANVAPQPVEVLEWRPKLKTQ
ncbi:BNR repeat-containing protein [Mucilaginibacter sp. PAMB04274]|uniref:BNR repeat-containing protein n=1 Tax=Mucilaginibacter sp. PAMB04274 TaxID=3138568 RepID=UPI0031F67552